MYKGQGEQIQHRRNEVIEKARAERPQRFGSRRLRLRVPASVRLTFHEAISYS
jgi:hypothetical protein